jgi:hypothetical protein
MISLKIGVIMAAMFAAGSFLASPVQQAIAAVIATDVQCTGCVGTADVGGNAITAAKIKDGEVKAAEIATDAVGAAEIQGVTKLLFGQCAADSTEASKSVLSGFDVNVVCTISGTDSDDSAVAIMNSGNNACFSVREAKPQTNSVVVKFYNECSSTFTLGATTISVIVYDK